MPTYNYFTEPKKPFIWSVPSYENQYRTVQQEGLWAGDPTTEEGAMLQALGGLYAMFPYLGGQAARNVASMLSNNAAAITRSSGAEGDYLTPGNDANKIYRLMQEFGYFEPNMSIYAPSMRGREERRNLSALEELSKWFGSDQGAGQGPSAVNDYLNSISDALRPWQGQGPRTYNDYLRYNAAKNQVASVTPGAEVPDIISSLAQSVLDPAAYNTMPSGIGNLPTPSSSWWR